VPSLRITIPWLLLSLLLSQAGVIAQAAEPLRSPAAKGSLAPNLTVGPAGGVYLTWIESQGGGGHALRFARRSDADWSAPRTIAKGDDWFVNWADFPSLAVMPNGELAAHWLQKSGEGTYAYDVTIARSTDAGETWGQPLTPHRDGTQTEHGFVSLLGRPDGSLTAIWLDGREMKSGSGDHGNMTLRHARIGRDGALSAEAVLDPRVCECCQTSAAQTSDGPIVAYRNRSATEVRDIQVVRWRDGSWSKPRPVCADEWKIAGCPVNGPSLAAAGQSVVVAWFTASNDKARVNVAFSSDAGETFDKAVRIDHGSPIGRATVLLLDDGSALVAWLERVGRGGELRVRRVRAGNPGESLTVAPMASARRSGFPRMVVSGDQVVFAWTADGVKTATMKVPE